MRLRVPRWIGSGIGSGVDPVTGDMLTAGERVSWMVQRVMRRWLFLGVMTLLTLYVWVVADPIWRHPLTDVWNLSASYLAIVIEGVTAMALINQTRRDAVVVRSILRLEEQNARRDVEQTRQLAEIRADVAAVRAALGGGASPRLRDAKTGRFMKVRREAAA